MTGVLKKSKSNTRKGRKHNNTEQRAPKRAKSSGPQAPTVHLCDTDLKAVIAGVHEHLKSDGMRSVSLSVDNTLHPEAETRHAAAHQPAYTFNFFVGGTSTHSG
jgi:hypothetical protein